MAVDRSLPREEQTRGPAIAKIHHKRLISHNCRTREYRGDEESSLKTVLINNSPLSFGASLRNSLV